MGQDRKLQGTWKMQGQSCSTGVTGFAGRVVLIEPLGRATAPFSMELGEQVDRLWPHKPDCCWTLESAR